MVLPLQRMAFQYLPNANVQGEPSRSSGQTRTVSPYHSLRTSTRSQPYRWRSTSRARTDRGLRYANRFGSTSAINSAGVVRGALPCDGDRQQAAPTFRSARAERVLVGGKCALRCSLERADISPASAGMELAPAAFGQGWPRGYGKPRRGPGVRVASRPRWHPFEDANLGEV
jgi:hypothetical protein